MEMKEENEIERLKIYREILRAEIIMKKHELEKAKFWVGWWFTMNLAWVLVFILYLIDWS
jgi:hypothetical protein